MYQLNVMLLLVWLADELTVEFSNIWESPRIVELSPIGHVPLNIAAPPVHPDRVAGVPQHGLP